MGFLGKLSLSIRDSVYLQEDDAPGFNYPDKILKYLLDVLLGNVLHGC